MLERIGDLLIREPTRDEAEDLSLSRGELVVASKPGCLVPGADKDRFDAVGIERSRAAPAAQSRHGLLGRHRVAVGPWLQRRLVRDRRGEDALAAPECRSPDAERIPAAVEVLVVSAGDRAHGAQTRDPIHDALGQVGGIRTRSHSGGLRSAGLDHT